VRRPPVHEWAVLGEDADPVPGDPDAVAALGGLLRDTADEIWRESGEVRALASVESWKSDAAERFRNAADDAVGNLRKAYHRYDVAARAMGTSVQEGSDGNWASALEQAQQMAAKALRDAQTADADHRAATERIRGLPTDTPPTDPSAVSLRARQDDAASALAHAKGELQAAKDLHDRAARHAADRIHRAITHDGLHDSTWDKVGSDIGTALSDTGAFLKDVGETTVNDLASLGNSIIHNGPALASFTLGLGGMIIGGGGEVLGVALDATGGGAILGVPSTWPAPGSSRPVPPAYSPAGRAWSPTRRAPTASTCSPTPAVAGTGRKSRGTQPTSIRRTSRTPSTLSTRSHR
jgi:hypothetical protein